MVLDTSQGSVNGALGADRDHVHHRAGWVAVELDSWGPGCGEEMSTEVTAGHLWVLHPAFLGCPWKPVSILQAQWLWLYLPSSC